MKAIKLIIIFNFLINFSPAQENPSYVNSNIKEINSYLSKTRDYFKDSLKFKANSEAVYEFEKLLEKPEAFNYNYDSLKHISVLESENEKLRIFTWNIMKEDMTNKFFGYIQYYNDELYYFYKLHDKTGEKKAVKKNYSNNKNWFGAIYYEIVSKKCEDKTIYTLLGWKGKNALIQNKVIETLHFSLNNEPVFGKNNFRFKNNLKNRVVFKFSAKVQMILRYNEKQDLIVCDHLAPGNPELEGNFQFYGPDYSYDAFKFQNCLWNFKSNIDPNIAINYKKDKKIEKLDRREHSKDF